MTKTSLDKSHIKFLLLEGIHPSAVKVLQAAGYSNIESLSGALEGDALLAKIALSCSISRAGSSPSVRSVKSLKSENMIVASS